jgi:hypothetical protein
MSSKDPQYKARTAAATQNYVKMLRLLKDDPHRSEDTKQILQAQIDELEATLNES